MDAVYPSKTDAWLVAVLAAAAAASASAAVAIAIGAPSSPDEWATLASCALLGIALPAWLLVGTRYTLSADCLLVVSGPFRWRIMLDGITDVAPSRSPLSAPALSLDRLRIEYDGGRRALLISPRDAARFVRDLQRRRQALR